MSKLNIQPQSNGVVFHVKVKPCSSKTAISGVLDGVLKVKISAAPQKQKANQSLIAFLAKKFGLKKNAVHIISGQTNPVKKILIENISEKKLIESLEAN